MLTPQELERLLFIDIETVPVAENFEDLTPVGQKYWRKRHDALYRLDDDPPAAEDSFFERAGVFSEYAAVVCISCGYLKFDESGAPKPAFKTMFDTDEAALLREFADMIQSSVSGAGGRKPFDRFCGHNIKEFDLPFLTRRCIIRNVLPLPDAMQLYGKKPWEITHVDTLEMWKFGDFKAFISLELLADSLGLDTSKQQLNGAEVGRTYWKDKDYDAIKTYCEADVRCTMEVLLRLAGQPCLAA